MNTFFIKATLALALTGGFALRAQDSAIVVAKGRLYSQASAAAPVAMPTGGVVFVALAPSLGGEPLTSGASVQLPGGTSRAMPLDVNSDLYQFIAAADSPAALAATYPAGSYTVTVTSSLLGNIVAPLVLGADDFPPACQVVNYEQAQAVDPAQDFVVSLGSIPGATFADLLQMRILDDGTEVLAETLTGMDTEWTISSDTLEVGKTYELVVRYGRYAMDQGSFFQEASGFFSETKLSVKTTGGGGTGDTTPPTLVLSSPENGAVGVQPTAMVTFAFSEPMNTGKVSIQWDPTLDPAKFSYQWQGGQALFCTYAGGMPGGAHSWTLNPTAGGAENFRDVAGNLLAQVSGGFTVTGGGGGCEGETPAETAGFSLFKQLSYSQTGTGNPVVQTPDGAVFRGSYGKFDGGVGLGPNVTLEFPAPPAPEPHTVKPFTSTLGGFAFLIETFADQGALDAAYPNTDYAVQLRNLALPPATQVTNSAVLTFGSTAYPPTPHFANFTEAQSVNPASDFTLRWDALAGAGNADFIALEIVDAADNLVFHAPDACAQPPRLLPSSATSIVLPQGTLVEGATYRARLSFMRLTDQGKTLAGYSGIAGVAKTTEVTLKTSGGSPVQPPRFAGFRWVQAGQIEVSIEVTVGRTFTLLTGTSPESLTDTLLVTNPPVSPLVLTFPAAAPRQFLRARTD